MIGLETKNSKSQKKIQIFEFENCKVLLNMVFDPGKGFADFFEERLLKNLGEGKVKIKKKVLFCFFCILFVGILVSQVQNGMIAGKVTGADGEPAVKVKISILGEMLIGEKKTISDQKGRFRFMFLPSGIYQLTFKAEGFKTLILEEVRVKLGKTSKIETVLQSGPESETIRVKEMVSDFRMSGESSSLTLRQEEFNRLPRGIDVAKMPFSPFDTIMIEVIKNDYQSNQFENVYFGRNFISLLDSQRGIPVVYNQNGDLQIMGAGGSENRYFIDGLEVTDINQGSLGLGVPVDAIREVQVSPSSNAEFGNALGGVVNVITKSGSNQFHGDLILQLTGSGLRGKPRDILHSSWIGAEYVDAQADSWSLVKPGLQLGGYLIKDKVWFFSSLFPQFISAERHKLYSEGSKTESNRGIHLDGLTKLTMAVNSNIRINLSGIYSSGLREGDFTAGGGYAEFYKDGTFKFNLRPSIALAALVDVNLSPKSYLSFQGGFSSWDNLPETHFTPQTRLRHGSSILNVLGELPEDLVVPAGWDNITWVNTWIKREDSQQRLSFRFDFSHIIGEGNEHQLKAGIGWEQIRLKVDEGVNTPYWLFLWGESIHYRADGTGVPLMYGRARELGPYGITVGATTQRFNFYLQDSWSISRRFSINIGVRLEEDEMPSFSDTRDYAWHFGLMDRIAPRLGFNYDLKGDGHTKIFGHAGIYYDRMKLGMAARTFGQDQYTESWYNLETVDWISFAGQKGYGFTRDSGDVNGCSFIEHIDRRTDDPVFDRIQPADSLKPISSFKASLGLISQVNSDLTFKVQASYQSLINTIEDIGVPEREEHSWLNADPENVFYYGNPGSEWHQQLLEGAKINGWIPRDTVIPKPKRNYASLLLELRKNYSNNWQGSMSLEASHLFGNYLGLRGLRSSGSIYPMTSSDFDSWDSLFDKNGQPVSGVLLGNSLLKFRAGGAYTFKFGLTMGASLQARTGTSQTSIYTNSNYHGMIPEGFGDIKLANISWRIDFYTEYNLKIGKVNLNLNANVFNLTDNAMARQVHNEINHIEDSRYLNFIYKMKYDFMPPIAATLGARISF